ncbi:SUKH-4 family immunity protein [Streptomyces polygonati]|uniref:SUKH-4 family immunity protein n=1 Tax=Streptomyces polygonati TaxID=1617087 RepID=A0ABV8HQ57_9ACTN
MVTFAQAQERAERWVNGGVSAYETREIRVREFDLGFVVWSEARPDGPTSDEGAVRVVIARDSGEATLWPGLPIGELIRRYEEEYGPVPSDAVPEPPRRVDLEATSFLLTPPQRLQDQTDPRGVPDPYSASAAGSSGTSRTGASRHTASASAGAPGREAAAPASTAPGGVDFRRRPAGRGYDIAAPSASPAPVSSSPVPPPVPSPAPAPAPAPVPPPSPAAAPASAPASKGIDFRRPPAGSPPAQPEAGHGGWAGKTVRDTGEGQSVAIPATVFAPPISGDDRAEEDLPPGSEARTQLMPTLSPPPVSRPAPRQESRPPAAAPPRPGMPHTAGGSSYPPPVGPPVPLPPPGLGAADIADLETAKASRSSLLPPAGPAGRSPDAPPPPRTPGKPDPQHAATLFAGPPPPPLPPPAAGPPLPPPAPGPDPHYAATVLARPASPSPPPPPGAGSPPPPAYAGPPPPPAGADPHYAATVLAGSATPPPPAPPAYGYPPQPASSVPTVGPGYMAVLRYRAPDGSEQQVIRRSAPGTPHPEWQILHELRSLGVRPEQVLELHTELESCELPGGYCARMIRESWPKVRISHTAPYGRDHAERRRGVRHLLTHQGELHQVAGAPARPQPQRVPMPDPHRVQRVQPVGLEVIGQELADAFGPKGVFRFEQRAVSRQGVPDIVAQTLVWAGLPIDFGPFFWAQVQPGQPVPTLAELAKQRGVRPAADAGSYLVMGNDFGKQLCVQYGTAHIVAVPLEAAAGGPPVPPQFVNSSLPEFARSLALLGRMWRLRLGLTPEQAGRWTVDFQARLAAQDPAAIASPDNWWSVLVEQMWDGLL